MQTDWSDGQPKKEKTPEEWEKIKQERLEKKLASRRRKGFEIPRHKKMGMSREEQVRDEWNNYGKSNKKSYNIKGRVNLADMIDECEEDGKEEVEKSERFRVSPPSTVRKSFAQRRKANKDFSDKATQVANSGATWHSKGDIKVSDTLIEVKERGTVNRRGEKTISIPKKWLTTQAEEAFSERRNHWYLVFAYKGDEELYVIKPYDHELEIVHEHEELQQKYKELEEKYNKLKEGE